MSRETLQYLNTNTLIGYTAVRGPAWSYRAELQGDESNHYDGAVPIGDVLRRLFFWKPIVTPVQTTATLTQLGITDVARANGMNEQGEPTLTWTDPARTHVVRPDTREIFGTYKGFEIHDYEEWLLQNVSTILGDTLNVGSAGLLRGGAVAWVQIEAPETLVTPEGVTYRPNLLAVTSLDGSISTTYKPTVTNVVCDNTMAAGLAEKTATVKIKHSKYSKLRVGEVRSALGVIETIADNFAAEVKALCETTVTDKQWDQFLELLVPIPEGASGRATTMGTQKRDQLNQLWNNDDRVSPWRGNGWGVVQAVNTWEHHVKGTRGETSRGERNMAAAVTGATDKMDASAVKLLDQVLVGA
jgi:phage/plasmid-like protein (TIGR03299 family)